MRWLSALAAAQERRPRWFALVALAIVLACAPAIAGLRLDGDLTALLPQEARSVRDLREAARRFGAPQTLTVLVSCERAAERAAMHRFARILAPRLAEQPGVLSADWSLAEHRALVEAHRHLYAPLEDLVALRAALDRRLEREQARANPLYIDLEAGEGDALDAILERIEARAPRGRHTDLFEHPDARSIAIFLRTDISGADGARVDALLAAVRAQVEAARPASFSPGLRVEYGGALLDIDDEQRSIARAAAWATALTLLLVATTIIAFFGRARALPILALGLVPPLAMTSAFAALAIGSLNASSAFLMAIVVGNGVNPHIVWLARYLEERGAGAAAGEALRRAHRTTLVATATASLAAAAAYASLASTDFRAFRDFGLIGAAGMVLAWVAAYAWTPVVALFFDRRRPLPASRGARRTSIYGRALGLLALSRPRTVTMTAILISCVSVGLVWRWVAADPFEYDFRNLRSQDDDHPLQVRARRISQIVDETTSGAAIAVIARTQGGADGVREQLERYREQRPRSIGAVRSIADLLPPEQRAKLPILRDIRRALLALRPHAGEAERARIDRELPPSGLGLVDTGMLPATSARPFTELDGTRGSVVYVEHHIERPLFDGRYLREWTRAARSARDGDGSPAVVAGAAPVVADLVDAISHSGPIAVAVALGATLLLLLIGFKRLGDRALALMAHALGILWMVAAMAALDMRLNFLNFVALPITFGNGVDYAVNYLRRYVLERRELGPGAPAARRALESTGGAVLLCSLTTVVGYVSLWTSPSRAVSSFGTAMAISEITCVLAAIVLLPAILARPRRP